MQGTIVSAPGKVLLTGGYVVLDRPNTGLVVGVTSRVFSIVKETDSSVGKSGSLDVTVTSPQYQNKASFWIDLEKGFEVVRISEDKEGSRSNRFVETVMRYVCAYVLGTSGIATLSGKALVLYILGDNCFYSQRDRLEERQLPATMEALESLPPFLEFKDPSNQPKTGLGSSAALVVSLVGAVLLHLGAVKLSGSAGADDEEVERGKSIVHNLSQLSHCMAQGKIGSGFDVSAAVYGTQEYVRFSPSILKGFENEAALDPAAIVNIVNTAGGAPAWDHLALPFSLPRQCVVMVGDVASGACTPVMVSKLLQWRKENAGNVAAGLWEELVSGHTQSANLIRQLSEKEKADPEAFSRAVDLLAPLPASSWPSLAPSDAVAPLVSLFCGIRERYESLRAVVRRVSSLSGVPIEPESLTPLLDATSSLPGVLISGCPGAGGEDAIFTIALGQDAVRKVEEKWRSWKENNLSVCALNVKDGRGGVKIDCLPDGYALDKRWA